MYLCLLSNVTKRADSRYRNGSDYSTQSANMVAINSGCTRTNTDVHTDAGPRVVRIFQDFQFTDLFVAVRQHMNV